ncbi:MAG: Tripartite tricarboxylate transporter TctB family [Firmicutes bacterium]|nr:Tripartite tricarboxylate transporter TctB family [Bacillota bacterium]
MKKAGVWAGIITLVYAIIIFQQSLSLDYSTRLGPGPGFFPLWLSGILIVLTLCYIVDSIRHDVVKVSEILPGGQASKNIISTVGGLIIFPIVVPYLGFVVSATILQFIMFVRDFKWYIALGISVAVSIILFLVFQSLLGVTLPVNDFGW